MADTEGTGLVTDANSQPQGVSNAIDHANVIRSAGKHIFVVAVGQGFAQPCSKTRIEQISGPDALGPAGFASGTADHSFIGFDVLAAALRKLATDFCASVSEDHQAGRR